jgi:hypothetical protein
MGRAMVLIEARPTRPLDFLLAIGKLPIDDR